MCADRLPPETPAGPERDGVFGDLLRRSREAQGIALGDVSRRTRIALHHLEALERSDLDALPAGPFARAYVRAYAEALGIDPRPVLEAHRADERRRGLDATEGERRMLEELSQLVGRGAERPVRTPRLRAAPARVAVAAAAVVFLAIVGWLVARRGAHEAPLRAPAQPTTAAARSTPVPPLGLGPPTPVPPPRLARPTRAPSPQVAPPSPSPRPEPPATARGARGEGATTDAAADRMPTEALGVSAFGVGTGVVERRLVGRADRFPEGSRVVFWTEVVGGRRGHVIHHVWFQGGRAVMRARLPIGGPHWRTHSTIVLPSGSAGWTVEARTSDGSLLARNDFVSEPRRRR